MSATSADEPDRIPRRTALVVDTNITSLLSCVSALMEAGFRVTTADTFQKARAALDAAVPTLLITDLTLGEYNGLHLLLRARDADPRVRAVVLSRLDDAVLRAETEQLGATFVHKPVSAEELRAAVFRTLLQDDPAEGPIRAPFERRHEERRRTGGEPEAMPERRRSERRRPLDVAFAQFRTMRHRSQ